MSYHPAWISAQGLFVDGTTSNICVYLFDRRHFEILDKSNQRHPPGLAHMINGIALRRFNPTFQGIILDSTKVEAHLKRKALNNTNTAHSLVKCPLVNQPKVRLPKT
jgi:hypothetical protein